MTIKQVFKKIVLVVGFVKIFSIARHVRKIFYALTNPCIYVIVYPFLKHEPFNRETIRKILLIRTDRIGDMILSTPALRAVRESFPQADIHLLGSGYTHDLLVDNPDIDKFISRGIDTTDNDYDLAISLHPGFKQNLYTYQSGARYRIGYAGCGGSFFLTDAVKDDRDTRVRHEVQSALEIVARAGCSTNNHELFISVTEKGEVYTNDFLKKHNLTRQDTIIAIHPGSSQSYIRWNKRGFARVADMLSNTFQATIFLIGNGEEKELVDDVASMMKEKSVIIYDTNLTQLVSIIKCCSLFIGNSSGPLHIAAALKIPAIAIFGATHPLDSYQEWGPWGDNNIIITKDLTCKHCHPTDCKTFDCMNLISPQEVFIAAETLLKAPHH
jgi:lipopolysaccharide heptosyltransferase II